MQAKHTFRLSTLVAALALGAATPVFAHSWTNDASLADSMAVGGDTSTTYQRFSQPAATAAQTEAQPVASVTNLDTSVAEDTSSTTFTPQLAAANTSDMRTAMASSPDLASDASADTSTGVDSDAAATTEATAPVQLVAIVVTDDSSSMSAADLTEAPVPQIAPLPVKALEPQIITREQVRDELRIARQSNTVSHTGELADTPDVLVARETFNTAQADAIVAEYRADYERQLALAEAESRRAQIAAEAAELATLAAMVPSDDQAATQVRVEVLDMSGE